MLGLIADRFERFVHTIGDTGVWTMLKNPRRPSSIIAVSACDADRVSAGDHVRPGDKSRIDCTGERDVRESRSPDVANRGKAGFKGSNRITRSAEGRVRGQFSDRSVCPIALKIQSKMCMGINES